MANFSRLHDLYSFPGFASAATVRGVFGDPYAVVISLRRRRKKHAAEFAARGIVPSTTSRSGKPVTSIVAAAASTWNSPSGASYAATAKP